MKAYTDLEQSKKLAEILPLESADMYWWSSGKEYYIEAIDDGDFIENRDIRAWSLAALLEEIPEVINFDDDESDYVLEISKENDLYYLSYGNPFEHDKIEVEPQEYFVDACCEMIIKLHEQKLL